MKRLVFAAGVLAFLLTGQAGFAKTLEEVWAVDESNCLELTYDEWEARDLHRKFTEFVLAPLRPLL